MRIRMVRRWVGWMVGLHLMGWLAGCATTGQMGATGDLYWPRPPEMPRYVWESVIQGAQDIERKKKGESGALDLLQEVSEKQVFVKPVRVAVAGGRLFVTDTMAKLVHAFDGGRRRYYQFGFRREGTLEQPLGIAADRQGLVYVADGKRKMVVVFDQLGIWARMIGDGKNLVHPVGVGVAPAGDRVYVVDNGGVDSAVHRLVIFDQEGKPVGPPVGRRGEGDGEFNYPVDVTVGADGRVYVLDAGNFRVQVFDREGRFLAKWGKVGRGLGQLARPRSVAVDRDNHLYVVDGAFANVQVFDDQGQLLIPIGERGEQDGPAMFASPSGVAADETGRIFVVDQWLRKVEILRKLSEEEGRKAQNAVGGAASSGVQ